jgi:hypothetical protein
MRFKNSSRQRASRFIGSMLGFSNRKPLIVSRLLEVREDICDLTEGFSMTLQELLGNVVGQLQSQEQDLNAADPAHPTHGSDILAKFQAAQQATSGDADQDLGAQFQAASQAIAGSSNGFTSKAYGDAFSQAAQQFQGRPNQLSAQDLGPIIAALGGGIANHDTRGVNQAGPLGALGPLLGMLGGGQQQAQGGGLDVGGILGSLMGNGGAGGALGSVLGGLLGGGSGSAGGALGNIVGGLLGGGQQQPQAQGGGLGGILGSILGGGQQAQGSSGMGDILGSLLGAVNQGANMTHANGQRDAGASSTGAILTGILGALLKR